MDALGSGINFDLDHAYEYLTKSIPYLSTDLKYSHRLLAIIKTSTHQEADIYISNVSNLHYFIMLDIYYISENQDPHSIISSLYLFRHSGRKSLLQFWFLLFRCLLASSYS